MAKKNDKVVDYVVKKAVKDYARKNNMMIGSDSYDAINKAIGEILNSAAARTKANKRKTIKSYDF